MVAEPANTAPATLALSVIPGKIVGKAVCKLTSGVKLAPSYTIPTLTLFTYKLVIYRVAPTEFKIVSGMAPDVPCAVENPGPTTINAAPVYTFSC